LIEIPPPSPLFNPLIAQRPIQWYEVLAGPYGLLAFVPLIPLVRLLALRDKRLAITSTGLAWLYLTAGPLAGLVLTVWVLLGVGYVQLLAAMVRAGRLSRRGMIALIWIGIHLMALPFWWQADWSWYGWQPSRLPLLHNIGMAYFILRLVAWGVDLAGDPRQPVRLLDTFAWLCYPPCMRLGPVLLRDSFLQRLAAWQPWTAPDWRVVGRRVVGFIIGGAAIVVMLNNLPRLLPDGGNVLSTPQAYTTSKLIRAFYLIPIVTYTILWTYNELAVMTSLLIGIAVDDNFNWLPASTSIRDYWMRWHVTVGLWLRNYVYIPLGGNRGFVPAHYAAVFGYCALWHGVAWSFWGWAALQTIGLLAQREWDRLWKRDHRKPAAPSNPLWTGVCWFLTIHYQVAASLMLVDFNHVGLRLFRELFRRL
jgi:alginate O-acetyltransferase complex protein AlgI